MNSQILDNFRKLNFTTYAHVQGDVKVENYRKLDHVVYII